VPHDRWICWVNWYRRIGSIGPSWK